MFRYGTLGKSLFQIMLITMIVCILLFGSVSYFSLQQTVQTASRAALETSLMQLKQVTENDYQSLLSLSQQMIASGTVGNKVNDYLHAKDSYDRGEAKRGLTRIMSTYAGLHTELVMYYDDLTGTQAFSNFMPDSSFASHERLHTVYSNQILSYYAIHESYSRISSVPVVSIIRKADFDGDVQYTIYAEQRTQIPESIQKTSALQGTPYVFLQMNPTGVVQYSTDEQQFPVGSAPEWLQDSFGYHDRYAYALTSTVFGARLALITSRYVYNTGINEWFKRSMVALVLIAAIVAAGSFMAYRYVFKGLRVFSKEIDKSIGGSLEPTVDRTRIEELDVLLKHFDDLKLHIKQAMAEEMRREQECKKLEIEALTYQINPHFLLNTLNSIHWLAAMNNQKTITRYIANLSTILSYNLSRTGERPTLRSEINILRLYLEIEQGRHDFYVNISVEEGLYLNMETPHLILQPIVENAIGHGIDEHGHLAISVWPQLAEGMVCITVQDDGCGIDPASLQRLNSDANSAKGIGLRYVHTMITAMYGDRTSLHIESKKGEGTCVTLTLPLSREGEPI